MLHAYLPQDRLRAIANDIPLPDRTSGSVSIEDLCCTFSPQCENEAISKQLNAVRIVSEYQ